MRTRRWRPMAFTLAALASPGLAQSGCANAWIPVGAPSGPNGPVYTSGSWDPDGAGPQPERLLIAGGFDSFAGIAAPTIAVYDRLALAVTPLDPELTGSVNAIAGAPGGALFAAGEFGWPNHSIAPRIAAWNGSAWLDLGSVQAAQGSAAIHALTLLPNGDLLAGGRFDSVAGTTANNIARWNGQSWQALGAGLSGPGTTSVRGLATQSNGEVVVVGGFTHAGGVPANSVARWDGAAWQAIGGGVGTAGDIAHAVSLGPNNSLIVVGQLTHLSATGHNVWRFDGSSWTPLAGRFDAPVLTVRHLPNGHFLIGGSFGTVNGTPIHAAARWLGNGFSALAGGLPGATVHTFALFPAGDVLAGGEWSDLHATRNAARATTLSWRPLVIPRNGGFSDWVSALQPLPGGRLVAGGVFRAVGNVAVSHVAIWDGLRWQALGSGLNTVLGLGVDAHGNALAGTRDPWVWNRTNWRQLGQAQWSGTGYPAVRTFANLPNGDLVVGDLFDSMSGTPANGLAVYSGGNWHALPCPIRGAGVTALEVDDAGNLLVAGAFPNLCGMPGTSHLVRWDGASWHSVGGVSPNGAVHTLAKLPGGNLVIGGQFTAIGGTPANRVARFDGSSWHPMATGLDGVVLDLAVLPNGDVVAGGEFNTAGNLPVANVARWDGTAWQAIGTGTNARVAAVEWLDSGVLAIGGAFRTIDGTPTGHAALLATTCAAANEPIPSGCSGSGGPIELTSNLPWTGAGLRSQAAGFASNAFAIALIGLQSPNLRLATIHPAGEPGCLQLADNVAAFALPAAGTARYELPLPDTAALIGVEAYHQFLSIRFDPQGQLTNISASNGLRLTIGRF